MSASLKAGTVFDGQCSSEPRSTSRRIGCAAPGIGAAASQRTGASTVTGTACAVALAASAMGNSSSHAHASPGAYVPALGSAAWDSAAWGSSTLAQQLASSNAAWGSAATADVAPDGP